MKRFVKSLILFSVALLVFLTVCDAITTYAFHHKMTRKYAVWNEIMQTDIDADVLIMGSSRAWCQYSPAVLDSILGTNAYNLGLDGSCFNRQIARYDIYRHYQRRKPKCIIQNVDCIFTLGKTIGYEREQFMPYMMYPYFRHCIRKVESFKKAELYIPMYRYYKNNFYTYYCEEDDMLVKGYHGSNMPWDGSKLKDTKPYLEEVDTVTYSLFVEYIETMRRDSIDLVLVLAPLYKDVRSIVLNMDEIHQIFRNLSNQYDIPLLDYSDCTLSQDTAYFYNATHLNRTGAELFTTKLAYDLDSLGIISRD